MVKAHIHVTLKNGVLDPQGESIRQALMTLGFSDVVSVRQGKLFDITLQDTNQTQEETHSRMKEICETLLINKVIENYSVDLT